MTDLGSLVCRAPPAVLRWDAHSLFTKQQPQPSYGSHLRGEKKKKKSTHISLLMRRGEPSREKLPETISKTRIHPSFYITAPSPRCSMALVMGGVVQRRCPVGFWSGGFHYTGSPCGQQYNLFFNSFVLSSGKPSSSTFVIL